MVLSRSASSRNLVLLAAVTAALAACSNGPKSASRQFYSAIGNGNTAKAIHMIDLVDLSPTAQAMGVTGKIRAAAESLHKRAEAHGGLSTVKILSMKKLDDNHAKVTAEMEFKDGTTQTSTDTWVKLHGRWLLDLTQN